MSVVLDASALLALMLDEPGAARVAEFLGDASLASVNYAEVLQRLGRDGHALPQVREDVAAMGLRIEPFEAVDAEACAALYETGRPLGLSLGDRACLALAQRLNQAVLTADRAWSNLKLPLKIEVIR